MNKPSKKKKQTNNTIAQNRRARHDYFLEEKFEAGLALTGWEVKALRAGKGQLTESYVTFHNSEAWLMGAQIQPLPEACTHYVTEPTRMRKLLMNRRELSRLQEATEQKGYTIVATAIYWKNHIVKCEVALGKGKQLHDKRQTEKDRDWGVQKQRVMRDHNK
ncbi:MAG: SsrA-binding protein [Lentisphaeria bacterium]|jgi:SsrA-binding protein